MSYALCPSGPCGPVKLTSLAFECLGVQWGKFKALLPLWWGVYFSSLQYLEANWVCVMGSAEVWGAIPGARLRESQCVPGRRAPAAGSMQRACCPPTQMAGAARLLYGHIWSSCRITDSKVLSVSFVWFYVSLPISNLLFSCLCHSFTLCLL